LDKLDPEPAKRLLDIACGEGHLLRFALKQGLRVNGVDFSKQAISSAYHNLGTPTVVVGDAEKLPYADYSFDYATNLGSLEHFVSPERGLAEMRRVLTPDGTAALVLPNSYYLLDIFWHVWRRGYPVTHRQVIERFATYGEWRDLIQNNGFRVVRAYKYNLRFPRTLSDLRWYWKFPRKTIYFLLSPFTPFNLSYSFLFICKPDDTA
jgi:ubiquinone/menaquinone biosynthesis C-methylase UbiE